MSELLTTAELARRLRYRSPSGVHMAVRRGQLPAPMVRGRYWLFAWDAVASMLPRVASVGVMKGTSHDVSADEKPQGTSAEAAPCGARSLATEYGTRRDTRARHQPNDGQDAVALAAVPRKPSRGTCGTRTIARSACCRVSAACSSTRSRHVRSRSRLRSGARTYHRSTVNSWLRLLRTLLSDAVAQA